MYFRYSAVSQPFAYRAVSLSENVNNRVFKYLIIIITVSFSVNVSRFFETKIVTNSVNVTNGNTFEVRSRLSFELSDLRKHPDYIRSFVQFVYFFIFLFFYLLVIRFYINWFRLIFTCLLPVIALIIFNYKIYQGIR